MSSAWIGAGLALLLLVLTCLHWVPRLPRVAVSSAEIDADFTHEQRDREERFHERIRPWGYLSLVISLLIPVVLTGSGAVARIADSVPGGWAPATAVATTFVLVSTWAVGLPAAVRSRLILLDVGLATGSWGRWWRDAAVAELLSLLLAVVAAVGVIGAARLWPFRWWLPVAAAAVVLVVVLSFILPVVVEPMFSRFIPLAPGELRDELLQMADRDGVHVREVLVADASKRTSALNAYVSGFGPTRRIVVHDTLLDRDHDDEVVAVVAHELGHVVARDVIYGTLVGAFGAAALVFGLAILLDIPAVLVFGHASGPADPAVVGILIIVAGWTSFIAAPVMNGISRRIERQADQHSFELTQDPAAMVRMHQALAIHNVAALRPRVWRYVWFASHPTSPERIKAARMFAGQRLSGG